MRGVSTADSSSVYKLISDKCLQVKLFTCPHRVALSHSSSADSISDVHGPGTDDTHNVSQWREVLPGEEIPFEFEAREKLRHRYGQLVEFLIRIYT